jgi:uncharacterized membrane protein
LHFEVSLVVKVPREKAYSAYIDFESMPKWSKQSRALKVTRQEKDLVQVESEGVQGGRGHKVVRILKLFPQDRVESENETRFARTKSVVLFEEVPGGTKVTASLDVRVKGHWSWILRTQGKNEAESSAMQELTSFAEYLESLP